LTARNRPSSRGYSATAYFPHAVASEWLRPKIYMLPAGIPADAPVPKTHPRFGRPTAISVYRASAAQRSFASCGSIRQASASNSLPCRPGVTRRACAGAGRCFRRRGLCTTSTSSRPVLTRPWSFATARNRPTRLPGLFRTVFASHRPMARNRQAKRIGRRFMDGADELGSTYAAEVAAILHPAKRRDAIIQCMRLLC
jgi:hypothetical protein